MNKPLVLPFMGLLLTGLFIGGCKKDEKKEEVPAVTTPSLLDETYRFTGMVGTDNVNISVGSDGSLQFSSTDFEYVTDSSSRTYQSSLMEFSGNEYVSVSKGAIEFLSSAGLSSSTVMNYFAKGTYNQFLSYGQEVTADGISISFRDKNGESWSTDYGSQTGSSFVITDVAAKNESNQVGAVIKATINCKVYSSDGSRSLTMTNCTLVAIFTGPMG